MVKSLERMRSDKSGNDCDYFVVDSLPSRFRSYGVKRLYVRGLYFGEALSLSKYVGDRDVRSSLEFLLRIYGDVVRGIDLLDLELFDFFALTCMSSIFTQENHHWVYKFGCGYEGCDGELEGKILFDDIEFVDPVFSGGSINFESGGVSYKLAPLLVRDVVEFGEFKDVDDELLVLAGSIKGGMSLGDRIRMVECLDLVGGSRLRSEVSKFDLDVYFKSDKCGVCGKESRILVSEFSDLKSFP